MSFPEVMGLMAGALQFVVAGYALRLNRLFGTARVGWSLFWAFLLLALLHLLQFATPFHTGSELGVQIEVLYSLISLLLLTGLVHMETLLKARLRVEREQLRMQSKLKSQVKKQTAHLTRAIQNLEAEINERKRMELEVGKTHRQLLAASHQAGMARIANSVLNSVGLMLKSVNASATLVSDQVKQSKIANVVHVGALVREHAAELGDFMANDPRGQKLPIYIAQLAEHLSGEQDALSTELESLRNNLEYIKKVIAMQQASAATAGAVEAVNGVDSHEETSRLNHVAAARPEARISREGERHANELNLAPINNL